MPLSDIHSIRMKKLAQPGEGWGVHAHPLHSIYHHVQSCGVKAPAERALVLLSILGSEYSIWGPTNPSFSIQPLPEVYKPFNTKYAFSRNLLLPNLWELKKLSLGIQAKRSLQNETEICIRERWGLLGCVFLCMCESGGIVYFKETVSRDGYLVHRLFPVSLSKSPL